MPERMPEPKELYEFLEELIGDIPFSRKVYRYWLAKLNALFGYDEE